MQTCLFSGRGAKSINYEPALACLLTEPALWLVLTLIASVIKVKTNHKACSVNSEPPPACLLAFPYTELFSDLVHSPHPPTKPVPHYPKAKRPCLQAVSIEATALTFRLKTSHATIPTPPSLPLNFPSIFKLH